MTEELASLLDGPVAERFGRARGNNGSELYLREGGDTWCSDTHEPHYLDGCCEPDSWGFNHDRISIGLATADALWISHLLDQCGERSWSVLFSGSGGENLVSIHKADVAISLDMWSANMGTRLEALARAMLLVPVEATP